MKTRIVIADDHRMFLDGIKSLLSDCPDMNIVGEAGNGEELCALAAKLHPEIILTDIQMPFKDGPQATKEIHKKYPAIKIIALSMLNESLYIRKMLEAGASGYILKTVGKNELISSIRKIAAGEKYFSPEVTAQLMNNFNGKSLANPADSLTKREKEILALISKGFTDREIAAQVFLSPLTITTHRKNMLTKLGLKNKVELTRFALEHNISN